MNRESQHTFNASNKAKYGSALGIYKIDKLKSSASGLNFHSTTVTTPMGQDPSILENMNLGSLDDDFQVGDGSNRNLRNATST